MSAEKHKAVLATATGKDSVADAISWIAQGHDLASGADVHAVLRSVVAISRGGEGAHKATQRLARAAADSELDSAEVLFGLDEVDWPERFRRSLDVLAWRSPDRTLAGLTAASVAAAQRDDRFAIRTLCGIAGVSYRDLVARVDDPLPADPDGTWTPGEIRPFFSAIDEIVEGSVTSDIPGAVPVRALTREASPRGGGRRSPIRAAQFPSSRRLAKGCLGRPQEVA